MINPNILPFTFLYFLTLPMLFLITKDKTNCERPVNEFVVLIFFSVNPSYVLAQSTHSHMLHLERMARNFSSSKSSWSSHNIGCRFCQNSQMEEYFEPSIAYKMHKVWWSLIFKPMKHIKQANIQPNTSVLLQSNKYLNIQG